MAAACSAPFFSFFFVLVLVFCLFFFRVFAMADDGEELLRFRAGITEDPDGVLTGWGHGEPCDWHGVSCNAEGRVTKLDLTDSRLLGFLQIPLLSAMDALQELLLSKNNFSGQLPPGFFSACSSLQILNLSHNRLNGSVPSTISRCSSLQSLDLSSNHFTGNIPEFLTNCSSLTSINLSFNSFSGGVPASLDSCAALLSLNLSDNQLGGQLPESLGNLRSIKGLYLSNNQIIGSIPEKLAGLCSTLQELDLSENNLTGSIPLSFASCTFLKTLNLAENNLSGDVPTATLSSLSSLENLLLGFNSFTGSYPIVMKNCSNLKILDLSSNKLSGILPAGICPFRFGLQELWLPNNEFTGKIPADISNCTQLEVLDLSFNNLEGPIPPELGSLSNLETLSMWLNKFTGEIPAQFGNMLKLKNLILNHNSLSGSIPVELTNSTVLEWVSLTSNFLTGNIPHEIGKMEMLTLLMLGNNSLSGGIPSEIGNCSNLLWLDLNTNNLTGIIPPRLGRLATGSPARKTLGGNVLAFIRNLGRSCRGIGIGTLIEFHGITEDAVWKAPLRQSCPSMRFYKGDSLNDNPDFSSIQVIDLSYNSLRGSIPTEIGYYHALTMLNLANNELTGPMPATFAYLRNLGVLDLSNNALQGSLWPLANCSFLVQVDVSSNNFTGLIPATGQLNTAPASVYANNPHLCGEPLPPCGSTYFLNNSSSQQHGSSSHNRLAIFSRAKGIVLGILICITCIVVLVAWIMIKRIRSKKKDNFLLSSLQSSYNGPSSNWILSSEREPLSINVATFERPLRKLTFAQLIEATNGFSQERLIGAGGFGEVYKAELKDGTVVAIKKLIQFSYQGDREFMAEMETLGKIKHRHLVPLLGYCKVGEERLLVYEYMHGGSLDEVLHGSRETQTLSWDQRKAIAKGAAKGLTFLHHNCIPHIIHRDMKSSNVLLDKNLEAYVSDFGMARLINAFDTHLSVSTLAGTPGYVPPEYYQSFRCTTKGDVYSFGVIILELLTGKRPTNKEEFGDSNLIGWVKQHVNEGKSVEVLDSELRGTGAEYEMLQCLRIACECLEDQPSRRPTMAQVVAMFKELVLDQE